MERKLGMEYAWLYPFDCFSVVLDINSWVRVEGSCGSNQLILTKAFTIG